MVSEANGGFRRLRFETDRRKVAEGIEMSDCPLDLRCEARGASPSRSTDTTGLASCGTDDGVHVRPTPALVLSHAGCCAAPIPASAAQRARPAELDQSKGERLCHHCGQLRIGRPCEGCLGLLPSLAVQHPGQSHQDFGSARRALPR